MKNNHNMVTLFFIGIASLLLSGCLTSMAIIDVVGSGVIYTGKTVIRTVDAITPDIVNKDSK